MFIPSASGATAFTDHAAQSVAFPAFIPPLPREQVRHLLFGTLFAVQSTIRLLHKLSYAEPNDWSLPMSTGRPNEVMAILTKRVGIE